MFHGVRVHRRMYYIQKRTEELFTLNQVQKSWDGTPKERWHVHTLAEITPEIIVLFEQLPSAPLYDLFLLTVGRINTVKHNGQLIKSYGLRTTQCGVFPVTITGTELLVTPAKMRVWDTDKQKELNDEIKRVRKAVKLRLKFGVFHELTDEEKRRAEQMLENGIFRARNNALNILKGIDEENYDSFLPLIYYAQMYCRRGDSIEKSIESALNSWRRRAQVDNEVVKYE